MLGEIMERVFLAFFQPEIPPDQISVHHRIYMLVIKSKSSIPSHQPHCSDHGISLHLFGIFILCLCKLAASIIR
jgi:hypothetical protein